MICFSDRKTYPLFLEFMLTTMVYYCIFHFYFSNSYPPNFFQSTHILLKRVLLFKIVLRCKMVSIACNLRPLPSFLNYCWIHITSQVTFSLSKRKGNWWIINDECAIVCFYTLQLRSLITYMNTLKHDNKLTDSCFYY